MDELNLTGADGTANPTPATVTRTFCRPAAAGPTVQPMSVSDQDDTLRGRSIRPQRTSTVSRLGAARHDAQTVSYLQAAPPMETVEPVAGAPKRLPDIFTAVPCGRSDSSYTSPVSKIHGNARSRRWDLHKQTNQSRGDNSINNSIRIIVVQYINIYFFF